MSLTRRHPAGMRHTLAVLPFALVLLALSPVAVGQSGRQLDHAVGSLVWRSIDENFSDDPGRTWMTSQEAIITVRLVRDTSIQIGHDLAETYWIDDGSSFRAQVAWDFAVPYTAGNAPRIGRTATGPKSLAWTPWTPRPVGCRARSR